MSRRFVSSSADRWSHPRQSQHPGERRHRHGPLRPMEDEGLRPLPWLAALAAAFILLFLAAAALRDHLPAGW